MSPSSSTFQFIQLTSKNPPPSDSHIRGIPAGLDWIRVNVKCGWQREDPGNSPFEIESDVTLFNNGDYELHRQQQILVMP